MNKKIFFFDIDGTLADKNIIPADTITALNKLKQLGHYIFICSGRPYIYAKEYYQKYVDGFICGNGRYIVYKDQILLDEPLTLQEIKYFVDGFMKLKCGYNFNGSFNGYAHNIETNKLLGMQNDFKNPYYIEDFKLTDINAHMFDVHFEDEKHFKQIAKYFDDCVIFNVHNGHNSADATVIGYDKGVGITKLLKILNIPLEDSYAFGDGLNDISMFKAVGHSIAMLNGVDEVKKACEYITSDINDGGIYKALVHYKIIE